MDARFISNASKITAKPNNYLKKHVFMFSDQERNLCKHGVCVRMNRKKILFSSGAHFLFLQFFSPRSLCLPGVSVCFDCCEHLTHWLCVRTNKNRLILSDRQSRFIFILCTKPANRQRQKVILFCGNLAGKVTARTRIHFANHGIIVLL